MIPAEATTEGSSLMTGILGGAVGAIIALVGTLFVHLFVVPRVDARRRREERWEQDVLTLGEYLTDVVSERARAAESAAGMVAFLSGLEGDEGVDQERLEEARQRSEKKSGEAHRAFEESRGRVQWLCDRVVGLKPAISVLMTFGIAAQVWEREALIATMYGAVNERDQAKISKAWTKERESRDAMVEKVKQLALGTAPRATLRDRASDVRHRAGQRLQRLTSKLRKADSRASAEK